MQNIEAGNDEVSVAIPHACLVIPLPSTEARRVIEVSKGNGWHKPANYVSEVVARFTINGVRRIIVGPIDKIEQLIPKGACMEGYEYKYSDVQRAKRIIERERQQLIAAT